MAAIDTAWYLEDFNLDAVAPETIEGTAEPVAEAEELDPARFDESNAWTDGFLQASRLAGAAAAPAWPREELTAALEQVERRLQQSAEAAAALIARTLMNAVTAVSPEQWQASLESRLQSMIDTVKPALLSTVPEITFRASDGEVILATDGAGIGTRAATPLVATDSVTVSWQLGSATTSREACLQELALAILPLTQDVIDQPLNPSPARSR